MTRAARIALGALIAASAGASAQQPAQPERPARFETATSAVVVDVVARDRKGPVTDLTQADFEVYEDGTLQQIATFERRAPDALATTVQGVPSVSGAGNAASGPPVVVALAWDRLSPEARALAHKAAQTFISQRQPSELVGVFITDQSLRVVEGYTTDPAKLKTAVDRVAGTATSQTTREGTTMRDTRKPHPSIPVTAGAEFGATQTQAAEVPGQSGQAPPADPAEQAVRDALDRMDRSYRDLQSNIEGQASMNALLALVDSLGTLPGRKTVVYFCEGLTVAPAVEAKFRSIIATANRKNVSIYALDAAGLRAHSAQRETASELGSLASSTVTGLERDDSKKWSEDLERNEELLKQDPSASLGILTDQTGGILIQNTNALDRGIGQINDDRRNYYALTYVPTNGAMDGTYRKIEVKVKRPGVTLRTRPGYLAVPANEAAPVLTFEAPALAAIAASPRPTAFPVQARALSVPMPGNLGMTALIASFGGDAVTFAEDGKTKTYAGEATVLARVTDGAGEPLAKQSQQYQLTGQIDQLPQVKAGTLIFFRTPDLPPGTHKVAMVVHDGKGKRSSVVETAVEVPGGASPVVGSLFVVARAERVDPKDTSAATHPLAGGGVLLYPSFGEAISRKAQGEIAFALPMVIDAAGPAPSATLELLQKGQSLAQLPLPLDKPDEKGRLLQVSRLPSAAIPPGQYELRITISAGSDKIARSTPLTVIE
jgi:VWFA-related protein